MTYIVHGATGAQGAPVLHALTIDGHDTTAAVRTPANVAGVAVHADLTAPDSLVEAWADAQGVFLHLPVGPPDMQLAAAHAIGEALQRARPARVVFSSSGYPVGAVGETDGAGSPVDVVVSELTRSGLSYAVVEPRLFLENLLLPPIHQGVDEDGVLRYPVRADYAVSWSSHLDVAEVVARLLTDHATTGIVTVGALPGLLGVDLAAGFAEHLGREVTFEPIEPAAFGRLIAPLLGEAATQPVVDSYAWRSTQPDEVIAADRSAQQLLGMAPRTVSRWLSDVLG